MDIALLNVKITFQRAAVTVDEIGNHANAWTDFYTCHATVSGEGGGENAVAGTTVESADLTFTVRWCKLVSEVTTTGFRVSFNSELYDILSIDHQNYKKESLRFKCRKQRR